MNVDPSELAQRLYEASACYEEEGVEWEDQHGAPRREALAMARAAIAVFNARRERRRPEFSDGSE